MLPTPPFPDLLLLDLRGQFRSASWQMAVDEAILQMGSALPILRLYRWAAPVITFGYFQEVAGVQSTSGAPLQRRWTGGGVVEHGEDFAYSLILPARDRLARGKAQESYRVIHRCLAQSLVQCGLPAVLSEDASGSGNACFQHPVAGDVLCNGKKIAGAAQRRGRFGVLHQGSVQAACPGLATIFPSLLSLRTATVSLDPTTSAAADRLDEEKYATDKWKWLR